MNWFFIAGNFRSGTTLTRLCLDSHKDITCFDERNSYEMLGGKDKAPLAHMLERIDSPLIGFKVPKRTLVLPQAWPVWDERYGEGKCIYMLRDARAVVASILRLTGGRYWNERTQANAVNELRHPILQGNYVNEIEALENVSDYPVAIAALYWRASIDMYYRLKEQNKPVMGVLYEDLVAEPESVLNGICEFLEIDFDPAVLQPHQAPHGEVTGGIAIGGSELRAIDIKSVDRWKNDLSDERQKLILEFSGEVNERIKVDNESSGLIIRKGSYLTCQQ